MKSKTLRRTAGSVTAAILMVLLALAIPAVASDVTVTGDCDGWTVHIDGTWGAYHITVDGITVYGTPGGPGSSGQGDPIDWFVPDTTDATSRTFVVTWHNHTLGPNTISATGTRVLNCVPATTSTTAPPTTTTTAPTTTTTAPPPTTTTAPPTTTTAPPTTTTISATTVTTSPPEPETTSTTSGPVVQGESTTTSVATEETLPFTGVESEHLAIVSFLALVAGSGLVWTTRRSEESQGELD